MKIWICGANGQLGTELQNVLNEGKTDLGYLPLCYNDVDVVCTDSSEIDITNEEKVHAFARDNCFDLIVNCAAMTNVDGCEENEDEAYRINALGAQNLALAAQATSAKLVHISTDYVFSGDDHKEYIETDRANPQSAYGRTKLASEKLVLEACESSFIIRTAWLFGAHGPNFVVTILNLARKNGKITVVDDQCGNPTYAQDLAYELFCIAETNDYGIYHCTNSGTCSWFEFASAIVDDAGIDCEKVPCTTEQFKRPAKRPAYAPLRNKHLEDTIGDSMRPWQEALSAYLERLLTKKGVE